MTVARRIFVFLMMFGVVASIVTPAIAADGSAESQFVSKINAERTSRGLEPLEVYWDLKDDARAHSQRMMDQNNLHHNPSLGGVTSGWFALGENVGVGPFVSTLHQAFMNSSAHRANILGNYNYVGVGVQRENDTKIWVTVVFMRGPEGLVSPPEDPPPPPEDPPPPPPEDPPPPPVEDPPPPPPEDPPPPPVEDPPPPPPEDPPPPPPEDPPPPPPEDPPPPPPEDPPPPGDQPPPSDEITLPGKGGATNPGADVRPPSDNDEWMSGATTNGQKRAQKSAGKKRAQPIFPRCAGFNSWIV